MNYQQNCNVITYLRRFDEILSQMSKDMLSQNLNDCITKDFICCMIPHHQAAIYMCENLLKYTQYQPLQDIAHDIIKTQTEGIEQMREILNTTVCANYPNDINAVRGYINRYLMITKNMILRMKNSLRSRNINLNFISEMIPHHEGAIAMCENLLKYCIDPRLKDVANAIIKEQTDGVRKLKEIRNKLCG